MVNRVPDWADTERAHENIASRKNVPHTVREKFHMHIGLLERGFVKTVPPNKEKEYEEYFFERNTSHIPSLENVIGTLDLHLTYSRREHLCTAELIFDDIPEHTRIGSGEPSAILKWIDDCIDEYIERQ